MDWQELHVKKAVKPYKDGWRRAREFQVSWENKARKLRRKRRKTQGDERPS